MTTKRRTRHKPEPIVRKLRDVDVMLNAAEELAEGGATVMLRDDDGGQGWRGNVLGDLDAGLRWMEKATRES